MFFGVMIMIISYLYWYASVISERKETLTSISRNLVADTYFSKKAFADQIISSGIHLVSRLRDDADLRYASGGGCAIRFRLVE